VRVLLVGLPGAGATTVGALLAQRLGWPFLDAEVLLERTGAPARALTLVLGMPSTLVAVVPDAALDDEADRARLAGERNHVVWLRCSERVLARRLAGRFGADTMEHLRKLVVARHPLYEEVADQVVDTDLQPPGAVANLVIEQVRD
jgi:shikimate kinase